MENHFEKVTILTLLSGRWQTWDAYWHGIENLDWPKDRLEVIFYTNATDSFVRFLQNHLEKYLKMGWNIRLYRDESVGTSENAFIDRGKGQMDHAVIIASLYNSAVKCVRTRKVFFVEDDIYIPSHSLKRLMEDLSSHPEACYVAGVQFDRHKSGMFLWDLHKQPKGYAYRDYPVWTTSVPLKTWGVQKIGLGHLGCTLIDKSKVRNGHQSFFRPKVFQKGADHFIGCDIVFCFENQGRCYADYDVRAMHYDAQGHPH